MADKITGRVGTMMAKLREVEQQILLGMTHLNAPQILSEMGWGDELSQRQIRRIIAIAKKNIQKRFDKQFETDFQWCKENYMRLFRAAFDEGDRVEQRRIINDYRQLAGLDQINISQKIDLSGDSIVDFEKFFA